MGARVGAAAPRPMPTPAPVTAEERREKVIKTLSILGLVGLFLMALSFNPFLAGLCLFLVLLPLFFE